MRFRFQLPGIVDGPSVEIERSFWTGRSRLWVDGEESPRQSERSQPFSITLADGTVKQIRPKGSGLDFVPRVFVDGQEVVLARRFRWYEHVATILPVIRGIVGGVLGVLLGFLTSLYIIKLLRTDYSVTAKVLSVTGLILAYLIVVEVIGMGRFLLFR